MIQLRVIAGGCETTLTVDKIISIDGNMYDSQAHPPESSLAARVSLLENTLSAVINDLGVLMSMVVEEEPITPPEQAVQESL